MLTTELSAIGLRSTEGRFFWYDVLSADPEATTRFLSHLLGWDIYDRHEGSLPGREIAAGGRALGRIEAAETTKSQPQWLGSVAVRDVAEAVKAAESLGARVIEPRRTLEGVGDYAVIADPQGAHLKVFASAEGPHPEPDFPSDLGQVCWSELVCEHPDKARTFYERWLGWQAHEIPMGKMGTYYQMSRDGRDVAGIMKQPPGMPHGAAWLHYVKVAHFDHDLHRVSELGGKVLMGPMEIPNIGRFALVSDPGEARFALYTP